MLFMIPHRRVSIVTDREEVTQPILVCDYACEDPSRSGEDEAIRLR